MDTRHPLAVVTPTLDGDVLNHLAITQAAFTPGQLARLLPRASVEGVRRVLNRLATQGVVTATRVGNAAVTYELNRDHLAADAIVDWPTSHGSYARESRAFWVPGLRRRCMQRCSDRGARGTARVDSDVDLFLVRPDAVDDDDWTAQVDALQHAVSRWTGNDVRPFVIEAAEFPHRGTEPGAAVHPERGAHAVRRWRVVSARRQTTPSDQAREEKSDADG